MAKYSGLLFGTLVGDKRTGNISNFPTKNRLSTRSTTFASSIVQIDRCETNNATCQTTEKTMQSDRTLPKWPTEDGARRTTYLCRLAQETRESGQHQNCGQGKQFRCLPWDQLVILKPCPYHCRRETIEREPSFLGLLVGVLVGVGFVRGDHLFCQLGGNVVIMGK